ncbi:hypothetical protein [Streptomyces sp. NPDC058294]|uniref:hypothetical protein n=1 Tax=Streptomyces sp. NPDC058294 TaxID=3346430 RepID=UPI0036E5FEEF
MSAQNRQFRRRRQTMDHALCGAALTPVQRISVFTIVLVVLVVLVGSGVPASEAIGLVAAVGAVVAQVSPVLSGQRAAAGSVGGA